ncbi:hypothetical protein J3458_015530 [Metarhizium acridum]|nr:hypothetical protein J3458_015530 [Metarhizium acridum]
MSFTTCRGPALRAVAKRFSNTVPKPSRTLMKGNFNQLPNTTIVQYSSKTRNATREIVSQTLQSIGSKREAQQYLHLFTSAQTFCVLKVGGAILSEHLDELGSQLAFLFELGLLPVIVHGAGPQLNRLLEEANVTPSFSEGIRVTDRKTLGIARNLFLKESLKLTDKLDQLGVKTRSLNGVFIADYLDKEKLGYVGKIKTVNTTAIEQSLKAGYIPIMTSMAESENGRLLNVNADVAAAELARALKPQPLKVVYLSEQRGLFDGAGNKISQINLDAEYNYLMSQPWCRYGTRLKIKESKELLDTLPRSSSVAIIHPSDLQKELFTDSGAGTLIRRGNTIQKTSSLSELNLVKMKEALLKSHKSLDAEAAVDAFLEFLKVNPFTAYYDENMSGLAIVLPPSADKPATIASFTITKSGWLSNLAENMFSAIKMDNPSLCWKVSEEDENLVWFFEKADGSFKRNGGVLFYCGSDFNADGLVSFSRTLSTLHTLR